jgi:hypothetical protein
MKRGYLFIAFLFTAFMFPLVGNVSTADALGKYGCGNKDKRTHVNCLRGLLSDTPYGIAVKASKPGKDGLGNYGCGNKKKKKHTKCLSRLLDKNSMGAPAPFDDGLMGAPAMNAPKMMGNHGGMKGNHSGMQGNHGGIPAPRGT